MNEKNLKDVVIIGGGPAGISAGIYLKRYGLDISLIEKTQLGGEVFTTNSVENYTGFSSINGMDLSNKFKEQLNYLDVDIIKDKVENINHKDKTFEIVCTNTKILTKKVLLATGRKAKTLNIPSEKQFIGKGISFCATCDAPMMKSLDVVVVGGGNSAFEEAPYIAKFAKSVTILIRNDKARADEILINKALQVPNISIRYNEHIEEYCGDKYITSIKTNKGEIKCDAVFLFIGLLPDLSYVKNLPLELKSNHILVDNNMSTNIKGIYAAGDIIFKDLYQIVTSCGEGAQAAYHIYHDLQGEI